MIGMGPRTFRALCRVSPPGQRGFTLLEVMIALTITGLVLGSLMTLSAGSKRLAFTARDNLEGAVQRRAAIQYAQLDTGQGELDPLPEPSAFTIERRELLPDPIRRTTPGTWLLQEYVLRDSEREEELTASRWVEFDVPR